MWIEAEGGAVRGGRAKFLLIRIAVEQARAETGAPFQIEKVRQDFDDLGGVGLRDNREGEHDEDCEFWPAHEAKVPSSSHQDKRSETREPALFGGTSYTSP